MSLAIVISAHDNVATALEALAVGQIVRAGDATVTVVEAIPRGHKIALRPIPAGDAVVKYGSPIGTASSAIAPGAHVHTHNLASTRGRGDLGVRPPDTRGGAGDARAATGRADPGTMNGRYVDDASAPRIAEPPDSEGADARRENRS